MSLEMEIMSYLYTYGNTKESDLAKYGTRNLGESSETIKRILDQMVLEGKILRLIHNKLGSKVVYFILDGHLPNEVLVYLETEILEIRDKDKARIREQALRILKEAEQVAKERIEAKFRIPEN